MGRPIESDDIVGWFFVGLICVLLAAFSALIIYVVVDGISGGLAKDRCGALGGKVEHYDPQHADLWRCVGARAEGE